jgi:site-specific DNA-cytosine methylase
MEDDVDECYYIDPNRITKQVLNDILDQPNVRVEMEKLYHEEWAKQYFLNYSFAINIANGSAHTLICSMHKAGVANILPLKRDNQHYTAFLLINETDSNQLEHYENPTKEQLIEYFMPRICIRKMTPRTALRLMDVEDDAIDKMMAYPYAKLSEKEQVLADADKQTVNKIKREGISKTNLYKLAGNSIVVNNLYHILRTWFIPNQPEHKKSNYTTHTL